MGKKKSVVLLTIISVILAVLIAMTFVTFRLPSNGGANKWNSFINYAKIYERIDVDLVGGYSFDLKLTEDSDAVEDIDDVVSTLKTRLNALNYSGYKITLDRESADEEYGIRIDVKAKPTTATDIEAIIAYGEAEFVDADNNLIIDGDTAIADAYFMGDDYVYEDTSSGDMVYPLAIVFTDAGYETILDAIIAHEAEGAESGSATDFTLKLVIGEDYSNPVVNSTIKSTDFNKELYLQVTSSKEDAERLAFQMRTGGLAYQYELETTSEISPLLGENADLFALLIVVVLVVLLCVAFAVFFKGTGLAMIISLLAQFGVQGLLLYLVPEFSVSFGTVIGIATAFVVSAYTMFVFANGFKKQYASGKTLASAISYSYRKGAFVAVDAHAISGALALGLVIFAKGFVRDFAIAFGVGVILSVIVSIALSWLLVKVMSGVSEENEKFLGIKRNDGVAVVEE